MQQTTQIGSWRATLTAYLDRRVLKLLLLGFSGGLPLMLIFGTLSLWLREAGVDRAEVTYFSWAALGYSFKFVWAPLIDRLALPVLTRGLGRRRAWLLLAQLAVICAIVWMALTDPAQHLTAMAVAAVVLGFSSATQDIVIDAYRIEVAERELQGLLSSAYIAGYRVGMLAAGAGALKLAAALGSDSGQYFYEAWRWTYLGMAGLMLVGVATTLLSREPEPRAGERTSLLGTGDQVRFLLLFLLAVSGFALGFALLGGPAELVKTWLAGDVLGGFVVEAVRLAAAILVAWLLARLLVASGLVRATVLQQAYLEPLASFFRRYGRVALLVLALIGLYRISDIVLGVISNVFYQDMGFSKDQIADITKTFGLVMTILGGFLGGGMTVRYGVMRILMLGAVLSAATNLLFMLLASAGSDVRLLILVIAADNLSAGLASAAFVAYLSGLTQLSFTAFQYALFSSIMTLFPKLLGGYSGGMVDAIGYHNFFLFTFLIGLPVMLLVYLVNRHLPPPRQGDS